MTNIICLNEKYSTTKLLTEAKPTIENRVKNKFETVLFLPELDNRKDEGGLRTKGYFKKSYDDKPLISIITVVFNGEKYFEKTIKSVIDQSYDNVEYIIIDGGSTDGTLDIIKKHEEQIDYWVSEKDEGIYDAMNKGIDLVSGDWINFMNAGDKFYDKGSIENIISKIDSPDKVYFGRAKIDSEYTSWFHPKSNLSQDEIVLWLKSEAPNHQAMFFPKKFYKNEKYDLIYKIFGDADYKHRAKEFSGFHFIDTIVCEFDFGGVSSSFDNYRNIKTMMCEAWIAGKRRKRLALAIKRIFIYNIKYMLRVVLGEEQFLKIVKKSKG